MLLFVSDALKLSGFSFLSLSLQCAAVFIPIPFLTGSLPVLYSTKVTGMLFSTLNKTPKHVIISLCFYEQLVSKVLPCLGFCQYSLQ